MEASKNCKDYNNKFLHYLQIVTLFIKFKIYIVSSSRPMADKEKKRGRWKYKNLNILRTKRTF